MEEFKWLFIGLVVLFALWYWNGGATKQYTSPFIDAPQEVR